MASPFDNMTDEQILALVREAEKPTEPEKPTAEAAPAFDQAAFQAAVAAKIEEVIRSQQKPADPAPQNPAAPPKFDLKTFTDKFVNDPDEGLDYVDTAKYGMPIRRVVPQMVPLIAALAQKVSELEAANFAPKADEERRAVEEVMKARGWQPSKQSYQDALLIAKASGMVKEPETRREEKVVPFIPPRTRTNSQPEEGVVDPAEVVRAAESMPIDKLEELLFKGGVINQRRGQN